MLFGIDTRHRTIDKRQWQEILDALLPGFVKAKAKQVET